MAKRTKKAKRSFENVHTEYDEDGHWKLRKNAIKGAIRQVFRRSPQMWETLQKARVELPPDIKKDGTPGKKPRVRYKCAICEGLFSQKFVAVDHIEPVVPLDKTEADMTLQELADGIVCKKDNLQVVCSTPLKDNNGKPSCHKIKTDEENYIRRQITQDKTDPNMLNRIDVLKEEFRQYLIEKEEKRVAKEKRIAERKVKRSKRGK